MRREVKKAMEVDKKSMRKAQAIQLTEEIYAMLKEAFRGGDTHANAYWVGEKLEMWVLTDHDTSYPYVID